jgi:hypothetical protein
MTNTVAHTAPKHGTSARLGLRLPKPRPRYATGGHIPCRSLILGPADVWGRPHQDVTDTSCTPLVTGATWYRPVPIPVVNVTATRGGEPVHVSEVVAELMKVLKPKDLLRPWPGEFLMHDMVDCCDTVHTWSADAGSWLPGCAHYGAV